MTTQEQTHMTTRELAGYLHVSVDSVYDKVQKGEIPVAFRWGPDLRFDISEVMRVLKGGSCDA